MVLVPSAMRGAADFAQLQHALAAAGYRSLAVNPRARARSTPPTAGITLRDLADDVAFVVEQLGSGRAHLVGHALGNIVVRATASYRPEVAATVAVMPCGGHSLGAHPVPPEVLVAFPRCHDETLSDDERLDALRVAFFAPGQRRELLAPRLVAGLGVRRGRADGSRGVVAGRDRADPDRPAARGRHGADRGRARGRRRARGPGDLRRDPPLRPRDPAGTAGGDRRERHRVPPRAPLDRGHDRGTLSPR